MHHSDFFKKFSLHIDRINTELDSVLNWKKSRMDEIVRYALLGKGKRLRPLLFIISSGFGNKNINDVYRFSTVFELMHTASLLHDDVLDHAEMRRRKSSVNKKWDAKTAILAGDYLVAVASLVTLSGNHNEIMDLLLETVINMAEGQFLELKNSFNLKMSEELYLEIIKGKTAELIATACLSGVIMSDAKLSPEHRKMLYDSGVNIGLAFQIIDDILDYTGSEHVMGKTVGKDIREGKITLPMIYTIEDMPKHQFKHISVKFSDNSMTENDYETLIETVRAGNAIEKSYNKAKSFIDTARKSLSQLEDCQARNDLLIFCDYIADRSS